MSEEMKDKDTEERSPKKVDIEEYINKLDSNGASVSASGIITRQIKEVTSAISELFNRDILKKDIKNNSEHQTS